MPPLTEVPPSFFAERGSEEAELLIERARTGDFDMWRADTPEKRYQLFAPPGELAAIVLTTLVNVIENGTEVEVQKEYSQGDGTIAAKDVDEFIKRFT